MSTSSFIFITRFYSGLFETIQQAKWLPTGIPTIVRLVENLAIDHEVTWVLICKNDKESSIVNHQLKNLTIGNVHFKVIPFQKPKARINWLKVRQQTKYELEQIESLVLRNDKALFYLDRTNIFIAALLKRKYNRKTVVRILGIYPSQKYLVSSLKYKLRNPHEYWAYKAKFDLCIATQDGSGTQYYLPRLMHSKVPKEILLNGIDRVESCKMDIKSPKIKILFIGSLQETKGLWEFLHAAKALSELRSEIEMHIVGKGTLEDTCAKFIEENGLADFVLMRGAMYKDQLHELLQNAHIYVSLNKFGSLSNTVLEAMMAGLCIVTLEKDPRQHVDEYTEQFIPNEIILRVKRNNSVQHLSETIRELLANRSRISSLSKGIQRFSANHLWMWQERINHEKKQLLSLLEK